MTEADTGLQLKLRQARPIPMDVELACAPGELLTLVGPSGSGKTAVLRAIAGLIRPEHGHISCNGEPWLDTERRVSRSPQRRKVGLVFQDYALFPHLSALHNVTAAMGHLRSALRAPRARELLAMVHLSGLERRHPGQLSGGQRQRVALARALAREPSALLLDEPFSAVDQVTRRKLQHELVGLRDRIQIPMLLVTHDLEEAVSLSDRICAIHRGTTLQAGPPLELMSRPRNALVARLMDLANVYAGEVVEQRDGATMLRWGPYLLESASATPFSVGDQVSWVIPSSHVVLHRRRQPSRGERENPVSGTVQTLTPLGENTAVTMSVDAVEQTALHFTVSRHVAARNALEPGAALSVSLLAEGIHLMPPDTETLRGAEASLHEKEEGASS